jgi:hypothetical protein
MRPVLVHPAIYGPTVVPEEMNTAFNHAQFYPNGSVDGNINDATFGHVLKAAPPRIGQVALKLTF